MAKRGRASALGKSLSFSVASAARDLRSCPVSVELPVTCNNWSDVDLVEKDTERAVPCQVSKSARGVTLSWLIDDLKARREKIYLARPAKVEKHKPAVVVEDLPGQGRVDVRILGKLFTSYHYGPKWVRPFLYPVIGPSGAQITRNWPIVDGVPGEHKDHIHHKSIWVAHGDCSRIDNWSEEEGHGWQRHRGFVKLLSGPVFGQIVAKNDWCSHSGRKQFEETRDMRFYALPGGERLFDITVTFRMTQGKVVFRDTKEGGLVCVRVASSMDVRNGGRIENGYGGTNESETWGKKAPWCDYSGWVEGKHVGIAVFDHEKNPRYPTEWHVRDYGLMTANCFAWSHYRPEDKTKGDMIFRKGAVTTWRYRLFVHRGDAQRGKVRDRFMDLVAPPRVAVE